MVVFFITFLIAMGWLLSYIAGHDFKGFAVYRIIAGIAILLFFRLALARATCPGCEDERTQSSEEARVLW